MPTTVNQLQSDLRFARRLRLIAWLFVSLMLVPAFAGAAPTLTELLRQAERPTMLQVAEALRENSEIPRELRSSSIKLDPRVGRVLENGPATIVSLEYVFPRATWALLGRDSAFLADLLEAYYLANGEMDRVRRLDASSASFKQRGDLVLPFLLSNGLKLDERGEPVHPYIIIDATSWRGSETKALSQSRVLISSVYSRAPEERRRHLLENLNVIGQGPATGGQMAGELITSQLDPDLFLRESKVSATGPHRIFYISQAFAYGHRDWHGSFGQFEQMPDGRVVAPPGAATDRNERVAILSSMIATLEIVRSPGFQNRVRAVVKEFGVDVGWTKANRDLFDDRIFSKKMGAGRWNIKGLQEWAEALRSVPRRYQTVVARRWWQLATHGLMSDEIRTGEFSEFVKLLTRQSKTIPGLIPEMVTRLTEGGIETSLTQVYSRFREYVLNLVPGLADEDAERSQKQVYFRLRDYVLNPRSAYEAAGSSREFVRAWHALIFQIGWMRPDVVDPSVMSQLDFSVADLTPGIRVNDQNSNLRLQALRLVLPALKSLGELREVNERLSLVPKGDQYFETQASHWVSREIARLVANSPSAKDDLIALERDFFSLPQAKRVFHAALVERASSWGELLAILEQVSTPFDEGILRPSIARLSANKKIRADEFVALGFHPFIPRDTGVELIASAFDAVQDETELVRLLGGEFYEKFESKFAPRADVSPRPGSGSSGWGLNLPNNWSGYGRAMAGVAKTVRDEFENKVEAAAIRVTRTLDEAHLRIYQPLSNVRSIQRKLLERARSAQELLAVFDMSKREIDAAVIEPVLKRIEVNTLSELVALARHPVFPSQLETMAHSMMVATYSAQIESTRPMPDIEKEFYSLYSEMRARSVSNDEAIDEMIFEDIRAGRVGHSLSSLLHMESSLFRVKAAAIQPPRKKALQKMHEFILPRATTFAELLTVGEGVSIELPSALFRQTIMRFLDQGGPHDPIALIDFALRSKLEGGDRAFIVDLAFLHDNVEKWTRATLLRLSEVKLAAVSEAQSEVSEAFIKHLDSLIALRPLKGELISVRDRLIARAEDRRYFEERMFAAKKNGELEPEGLARVWHNTKGTIKGVFNGIRGKKTSCAQALQR